MKYHILLLVFIIVIVVSIFLFVGGWFMYRYYTSYYPLDYKIDSIRMERVIYKGPLFEDYQFYQIIPYISTVHVKHSLRAGSIAPYSNGCADVIKDIKILSETFEPHALSLIDIMVGDDYFELYDSKSQAPFRAIYCGNLLKLKELLQNSRKYKCDIGSPIIVSMKNNVPNPFQILINTYGNEIRGNVNNIPNIRYGIYIAGSRGSRNREQKKLYQ